jgi:hypothetical protein
LPSIQWAKIWRSVVAIISLAGLAGAGYALVTPQYDSGLHAVGAVVRTPRNVVISQPSIFIRYNEPQPSNWLERIARAAAHFGGYYEPQGFGYVTFHVDVTRKPHVRFVDVLLAGFGKCVAPSPSSTAYETVNTIPLMINDKDPAPIAYLSEAAETLILSPVSTPNRAVERAQVLVGNGGDAEVDCYIAVRPRRVSYSKRYLTVDTVFAPSPSLASSYALPMQVRIAPPYSSANWAYDGEGLQHGSPRFLTPLRNHPRSDFPAMTTILSVAQPTLGVSWTYDEADRARELAVIFVGALAGLLVSLVVDRITKKPRIESGKPASAPTDSRAKPHKRPHRK